MQDVSVTRQYGYKIRVISVTGGGVDIIFMGGGGRKLDIKILIPQQSCGCRVVSTVYET